jgi:flagellar basal body-associated protein FliL
MSKIDFKNAIVHQKRSKSCKKTAIIILSLIIIAVITIVATVTGVMLTKSKLLEDKNNSF